MTSKHKRYRYSEYRKPKCPLHKGPVSKDDAKFEIKLKDGSTLYVCAECAGLIFSLVNVELNNGINPEVFGLKPIPEPARIIRPN